MAPAGLNIDTTLVTACFTTVSISQSWIAPMTISFRLARSSLTFSHSAATPPWNSACTYSASFSMTVTAVSPISFTALARSLG